MSITVWNMISTFMCTSTLVTLHPLTDLSLCYWPLFFQKITQKYFGKLSPLQLCCTCYWIREENGIFIICITWVAYITYVTSAAFLFTISNTSFLGKWQNMGSEFSLEVPCKKLVLVKEAWKKLRAPQDEIISLKRTGKNVGANTSTQIF
jgi:hypothetical protein